MGLSEVNQNRQVLPRVLPPKEGSRGVKYISVSQKVCQGLAQASHIGCGAVCVYMVPFWLVNSTLDFN